MDKLFYWYNTFSFYIGLKSFALLIGSYNCFMWPSQMYIFCNYKKTFEEAGIMKSLKYNAFMTDSTLP